MDVFPLRKVDTPGNKTMHQEITLTLKNIHIKIVKVKIIVILYVFSIHKQDISFFSCFFFGYYKYVINLIVIEIKHILSDLL